MKRIVLAAIILATLGSAAWAACPMGTRYVCIQGYNGKIVCGCR